MIELKNLTKRFDKVTAVDNMNLTINEGSVVGLVGSNGSGKSTLLRLLSGVYKPDGGEVLVGGKKLFDRLCLKKNDQAWIKNEAKRIAQSRCNPRTPIYN